MNIDDVKAGLARLEVPVVPLADPYGRLLRRARRSRRTRFAAWACALLAAALAVVLVPALAPSASPHPAPSPGADDIRGGDITPWIQRLLDSPAVGSLATDTTFVTDLTDRLQPRYFQLSPELNQQTVLFAGDVGALRAVLVAFHSDTSQMGVWLVTDAGMSASRIGDLLRASRASGTQRSPAATDPPITVLPEELTPYTATAVSRPERKQYLAIGVAPAGCQLATSDAGTPAAWSNAATGSYVATSDPLAPYTALVRVTCEGVVRQQANLINNARIELSPQALSDQQLDAAIAGVRGSTPDRARVRGALQILAQPPISVDTCRVLYAGQIPGTVAASPVPGGVVREPPVLVTACLTAHGNTAFAVDTDGGGQGGYSRVKFTDPDAIVAVRGVLVRETVQSSTPGQPGGTNTASTGDEHVLVLAPRTATLLQVVRPGQPVESVPLANGVASIVVPVRQTVQLHALDAHGTLVGSVTAPLGESIPEDSPVLPTDVDNWN